MRAYEVMHNYCKNNTDDSLTLCFDGKTQSPALMAQMWRGDFSEESAQLHARLAIELFAKEEKFISYNEYVLITKIIYLIFCSKEIVNFIYTYDDIVNFIEEIAQEIDPETGKNKHEIYILSNMSAEMYEKIKKHMPVKKLFELIPESHWIISSCINKIKPNRAIYEYILEKFNLDAKDCVFVDDQEENVKAADEVGIKSLQCTRDNRKEVIKKLRAYARH
jgi:putative hydrolase of the HAD superfamily